MAHVETIMTSAPPEEAVKVLRGLPGVTFLEHKAETTVLDLDGELIDVEEVRDEEGSFGGLTTAIDVYGSTDDDSRQRSEGLFAELEGLGRFDIGMHPDDRDNFLGCSHAGSE